MRNNLLKILLSLMLLACLATNCLAESNQLSERLSSLIKGSKNKIGAVVYDLKDGSQLFAAKERQLLKPASVLKILTSVVALKELGPEYRFKTEVWHKRSAGSDDAALIIRGGADPNLTSEELWLMLRRIKKLGLEKITLLTLDDSRAPITKGREGQRAYETGSSSLAFNFNSIAFDVCPGRVNGPALVMVDPWEAGVGFSGSIKTTSRPGSYSIDELSGSGANAFRVSGTIGQNDRCQTFYRSLKDPLAHFSRTIVNMARSLGITISRTEISETFPKDAQLIYEHESKPLALIVQDLNHFSNNFIAEQILLALGQNADGQMERGQGLKRLEEFADKIGPANEYEIYDASGLSHENRMSAKLLGQILLAGLVDEQIRPELESSLSVADRNGTLKRRSSGSSEAILRGKTGSLDGVSSLAGVVYRTDGTKLAFVLIQNEVRAKDAAMRLEDTFVRVLARG